MQKKTPNESRMRRRAPPTAAPMINGRCLLWLLPLILPRDCRAAVVDTDLAVEVELWGCEWEGWDELPFASLFKQPVEHCGLP
jgi:hypothetical protein